MIDHPLLRLAWSIPYRLGAGAGCAKGPGYAAATMAQPAAKRLKGSHSAAPPASIERRAVLDGQLAPLRDKERELKAAEAELHRRQAELQRQIAPLQREREAVSGYLQLLGPAHSRWSQPSYPEWAADIDFPSAPSMAALSSRNGRNAIVGASPRYLNGTDTSDV